MGATNTTANYSLSQFISTDKPAWLQDYNGDMLKIDTAINTAKLAADSAANAASAAQNDATTAVNGVSSLTTTVGTLSTTVGTCVGNINTINSLIGNGTPTTTDHTLIGAINELHANQGDLSDLVTSDQTSLVGAINEIAGGGGGATSEVQRATLTAGQTSKALTFTDITIGANTLIDIYTDDYDVAPTAVSVAGQVVTLTFEAQASNVNVAVKAQN